VLRQREFDRVRESEISHDCWSQLRTRRDEQLHQKRQSMPRMVLRR